MCSGARPQVFRVRSHRVFTGPETSFESGEMALIPLAGIRKQVIVAVQVRHAEGSAAVKTPLNPFATLDTSFSDAPRSYLETQHANILIEAGMSKNKSPILQVQTITVKLQSNAD